jgi:hypothetical protein
MPYGVDFGRIPVQLTLGCQGNQKWLDKWVPEDISAAPTRLKPTVQGPVVSKARLEALVNDMKTWRQDLARSEGNIQKLSQFHLLPDKAISKVRSKIRSIQTESDLKKVPRLVGYHFPGAFITDHIPDLLQCIQSSLQNSTHPDRQPSPPPASQIVIEPPRVPPPALPWMLTSATVDQNMLLERDQREQQKRTEKERRERERETIKGTQKARQEQEKKREAQKVLEEKTRVMAAQYERKQKLEAKKQKENKRQALRDMTNESRRTSGRPRKELNRWEG